MKTTTIDGQQMISIPKITDPRGNLAVVEMNFLPYTIQRVYYLYDVPSDAKRGGHAHLAQQEFLIAISGSFTVQLDDGKNKKEVLLNKPDRGLLITEGIWRSLDDFSSGAVCLVISSGAYDEADYIREYDEFIKSKTM
jgi:dTDP-4-dehydrorhamnose 3,5-epimerase-like enzyme